MKKIEKIDIRRSKHIDVFDITNAINQLVNHVTVLEEKVEKMWGWLDMNGINIPPKNQKVLKREIRELLFCHPMWGGQAKDTKDLADEITALIKKERYEH